MLLLPYDVAKLLWMLIEGCTRMTLWLDWLLPYFGIRNANALARVRSSYVAEVSVKTNPKYIHHSNVPWMWFPSKFSFPSCRGRLQNEDAANRWYQSADTDMVSSRPWAPYWEERFRRQGVIRYCPTERQDIVYFHRCPRECMSCPLGKSIVLSLDSQSSARWCFSLLYIQERWSNTCLH